VPWQDAAAWADPSVAAAAAMVTTWPSPCPKPTASALAPAALAWLSARYEQVEPSLPAQPAPAWATDSLAPTWLWLVQLPFAPAVQSLTEVAVLVVPPADAVALPSVWVLQPVPAQLAVTCTTSLPATPEVPAWQPPAASQVAVAVACTVGLPAASVVEEARVAQPPLLPSSQAAAANALVVTPAESGLPSPVAMLTVEPTVTWAVHALVPSHPVSPLAVLVESRPSSPAVAFAVPVTLPVQPASGQEIWEVA
jgi:hypothetical protein